MALDAAWLGAVASLISSVIVAGTAIVAFAQLRHYRNANDIVVYLRLIEQMDSPHFLVARQLLKEVARLTREDPVYRHNLTDPNFMPEEFRPVGDLLRFLEHISLLITSGDVAERLVLAEYADNFIAMWTLMRPMLEQRRVAFGPYTGRAFEHLAMRSKHYIDSGRMDRYYRTLARDTRDTRA